jgi:hypothetical protein
MPIAVSAPPGQQDPSALQELIDYIKELNIGDREVNAGIRNLCGRFRGS